MNGFQHLPSQQQQRFWIYNGSNRPTNGFQPWIKPTGISFVHIICIGAGAGGSGAYPYSAGTAARGGSGGGAGALNSVFLPAYLVPDTLYINIGIGGAGGASSNVAGTANIAQAGTSTYVGFYPVQGAAYSFCMANPGGAGTVPAAGAGAIGGNAGATAASTFFPNSQVGLRNYVGGQAGAAGGQNGGTSITAVYRITGGAGGSGNTAANIVGAGGSINMAGEYALTGATTSAAGQDGAKVQDLIKFLSAGGTGASSSTTISGSNGGWGGFGSGGGGGSVGPGLGGAGGAGGDGLVIITCG